MGGDSIGPYRITEQLGSGGMGEVFKAYDDRLDRWVAIKRIRPDKEEDSENRERLRREARAAARLSHSSIVHIYDIFQDTDSDCIVMEFVEGRSLNTLITDGPLEVARAAKLGREIAEGLAEAHSKGIVHRDLKTENVIVAPNGHAKILDFGLAKPVAKGEFDASLTGKGQVVGTSRAMSPEYVSGEDVDHRADLFALGVLLYEVLTCQSPFRAHNTLATLKRVILHRQAPAKQLNPEVPQELSDLIDRLLEKEPRDRPQNSQEVANELARFAAQGSTSSMEMLSSSHRLSETSTGSTMVGRPVVQPWKRVAQVLAVIVVVIVCAQVLWLWLRPPPPEDDFSFAAKDEILLTDFQNLTGDPMLDDSLDLAFRVGLEQSRYAKVVSRSRVREALRRMQLDPNSRITDELGLEICQRESIKALVVGRISKLGNGYMISAQILDPQTQSSVFTAKEESVSQQDGILPALQEIAKELRSNLGETLDAIESTPPLEAVTTQNLEALKAYSLAIGETTRGDENAAIPLLKRAIEIDPEFSMAHVKLAVIYRNLASNLDEISEHLQQALAFADRLTSYEKLYVEGWVAHDRGDVEAEIQAWQLMSTLFPENSTGHNNLAMAYFMYQHRFADAIEEFRKAFMLETETSRAQIIRSIGSMEMAQGDYEAAREDFEEAARIGGVQQSAGLVVLNTAEKRYEEAKKIIEQSLTESAPIVRSEARLNLALLLADQGKFTQALSTVEVIEQTTDLDQRIYALRSYVWAVNFLEIAGSQEGVHRTLARSVEAATELLAVRDQLSFSPIELLAILGKLAARNGDARQAGNFLRQIRELTRDSKPAPSRAYELMLQGEIELAEGQTAQAASSLAEGLRALEMYQLHESLGRAYRALGDDAAAIQEYEWITRNRGRAFVECGEICPSRAMNVLDWTLAHFHLGTLYARAGEVDLSEKAFRVFVEQWQAGAPQLPIYQEALANL